MKKLLLPIFMMGLMFGLTAKADELELKHSYDFESGTAKDMVGNADGTVVGGGISYGVYTSYENGDYISLPGDSIKINTYNEITIETYVSTESGANTGATMLWYFGATNESGYGTEGMFASIARTDDKSRTAISTVTESPWSYEEGVDGAELDDGSLHHVVTTIDQTQISFYVDGEYLGSTELTETNKISLLSNDLAYIAKGGYSSDPTWVGSIMEYNIYSGIMDAGTVASHYQNFPLEDNAVLDVFTVSEGTLSPAFSSSNKYYEVTVPYGTTSLSLTATSKAIQSEVAVFDDLNNTIDPSEITFGEDGAFVSINVTSIFGTTITYELDIIVEDGESDPDLKDIETSVGAIDPLFDRDVLKYTVLVPQGTTTVDVNGISNFPNATITGNQTVTLVDGTASASIAVTSYDESKTKTYTVTFKEVDGKNYALYLTGGEGIYSNVDISGLDLTTLPFTIEMWIRPDGSQTANAGLMYNRPNNIGLQYASSWQGTDIARFMTTEGEGETYGGESLTGNIEVSQWHHIAVVLTDTSRSVILDGVESKEMNTFSTIDFASGNLYLGWDSDGESKAFKGWIDEVRVWSKIIPTDSLQENKNKAYTGKEDDLLAYYSFDLRNSARAIDLTGKNHGYITGGTYAQSFSRNNTELKSLAVNELQYKPNFDAYVTDYYVTFPKGTSTFSISAEALVSEATITSGTGTINIESGSDSVIVKVENQGEYTDYVIHYNVETDLELTHSYTFGDGTARDVVSGADGIVYGGTIDEGAYTALEEGDYIELPGDEIAINTYPSYTFEAYIQQGINPESVGNAMLAYFGDFQDRHVTWIQVARNDDISKAKVATDNDEDETFAVGFEPGEDEITHVVFTVQFDTMKYYMNGDLMEEVAMLPNSMIAKISTENAWLCASGWAHDPTWHGIIYEFNIYKGAMDAETVLANAYDFPVEAATADASLSTLTLDGETLTDFNPANTEYTVALTGNETIPVAAATAKNEGSTVTIEQATSVPGTTTITVVSEDKTQTVVYTINYVLPTGVSAIQKAENIMVYPTFSNGSFTIETESAMSTVSVYNLSGSLVQQQKSTESIQTLSIEKAGMYLIKVDTENTSKLFKVIKTN